MQGLADELRPNKSFESDLFDVNSSLCGNLGLGNDSGMDRVHAFNRPGKGKTGNTIKYAVDSRT